MTPATKLALRRWIIRTLRDICWRADEWIHRQEMALRQETHDLSGVPWEAADTNVSTAHRCPPSGEHDESPMRHASADSPRSLHAKKRKRRMTAAAFDLRYAR